MSKREGDGAEEVVRQFPKDVDAPRGARELLAGIASGLSETERADLNIALSELVTNAVMHGSGSVTVCVRRSADTVRIEVSDAGEGGFSWPEPPEEGSDVGLGLQIVKAFTDRVGIGATRSTMVWCERDLEPQPSG